MDSLPYIPHELWRRISLVATIGGIIDGLPYVAGPISTHRAIREELGDPKILGCLIRQRGDCGPHTAYVRAARGAQLGSQRGVFLVHQFYTELRKRPYHGDWKSWDAICIQMAKQGSMFGLRHLNHEFWGISYNARTTCISEARNAGHVELAEWLSSSHE